MRNAVGVMWHHFHGIVNTTLETAHLDSKGLESCLDVLKYALCATICLDMPMERAAFVTQLARVKFFKETRGLDDEDEAKEQRLQHDHQATDKNNGTRSSKPIVSTIHRTSRRTLLSRWYTI